MEAKFSLLAVPSQRIKFDELVLDEQYEISKFIVTSHKVHGTSIMVEINVNGQNCELFLPKRFITMESDVPTLNSSIKKGERWMLQWGGVDGKSNAVKIFRLR